MNDKLEVHLAISTNEGGPEWVLELFKQNSGVGYRRKVRTGIFIVFEIIRVRIYLSYGFGGSYRSFLLQYTVPAQTNQTNKIV